jgi:threonylcarbamoyladenosine tRNA methylthiotransferase MtaB
MKRVFFKTFGCRTNIFDTEVMVENLEHFSVTENIESADYIVVNSCTVTNSADSNGRQFINRVKREYPEKKIFFTGCGIQTQGEKFFKENAIHSGFGHSEKERVEDFLLSEERKFVIGDLEHLDKTVVTQFIGRSRAFIKIQEGCNFSCSYCIIPTVRGESRSYSESHILDQIERVASNGFGEVVLTGTNIGSYGDSRNSLAKLLKKISQIRGVRRVRLGSVEPSQIGEEFFEILDEKWMGRYLHIALQYTDNRMLKIMNRRNRLEKDLELFQKISSKGYALGTDFIVGHGGETGDIFENGYKNLEKFPLTHIHLFRYSKRDGTPSAKLKEIDGRVVKERFERVEKLISEKERSFREKIAVPLEILVEEKIGENLYSGLDQFFFKNSVESMVNIEGDWIEKV